ncbi:MAG: hypothetical protein H0U26_03545 [Acidimicrobiia bacterium]|nr:hypothetical protein [Acidimicrobiia bacterium]
MAAMMAAMGTGLSVGYAGGMVWDLGWANLAGMLVGTTHGLVMGRRYGPMAALEGAGGGVMGGMMGAMLAIMLLYFPGSLALTAVLMLALQVALSIGAVYLVVAEAGAVGASGWLHRVGHVLGAQYQEVACCAAPPAKPATRRETAKTTRRAHGKEARQGRANAATRPSRAPMVVAVGLGGLAVLVVTGMLGAGPLGGRSTGVAWTDGSATDARQATQAVTGADGVQQLGLTLQYPSYEPKLLEAKAGVPLRLSLEAIGEPG